MVVSMCVFFGRRPHYGESKRYMMYERIVQSASLRGRPAQRRGRAEKEYEAAEVTQVSIYLCTSDDAAVTASNDQNVLSGTGNCRV